MNAEFQRIARRDKKAFLSDQSKEIEENNRMGKSRDLFKKIRDAKGTFHVKMGIIKNKWYGHNRKSESEVTQSCLFVNTWNVSYQASLSMGFSMQEYWIGLPFPSPGYHPDPGIKPRSPILQADALPSEPPGKPRRNGSRGN